MPLFISERNAAVFSKPEKDRNITISSMSRMFCAPRVATASISLGVIGKVALW